MSVKIYIDGQEGTTGLKILERFENRNDVEILRISEEKRKDSAERAKFINMSDYTFLCLPDVASREAVSFVKNDHVRIIDASTAHRINPDWAYGFPELSEVHREKIKNSKNDPRANLLNSLKPYLRDEKKGKIDQYMNLLNVSKIAEIMKDNNKENNNNV